MSQLGKIMQMLCASSNEICWKAWTELFNLKEAKFFLNAKKAKALGKASKPQEKVATHLLKVRIAFTKNTRLRNIS